MRYSTGVFQLDLALKGGLPPGVCEITGEDATGKTTLALSVMREASIGGLPTAIIYTDGLPDKTYFSAAGPEQCAAITPYTGEAALFSVVSAIENGAKVVVLDNGTNLMVSNETNMWVGETDYPQRARLVGGAVESIREIAKEYGALFIIINQVRVNPRAIVSKPKSSFDRIIRSYCDTRLFLRRDKTKNEYGELAYVKVGIKVKKSLVSPPNAEAFGFIFKDTGFDRRFELLRAMLGVGALEKAGAYFKGPAGTMLGPGYFQAAIQIGNSFEEYWRTYEDHRNRQ